MAFLKLLALLVYLVSFFAFFYFWWKKRRARLEAGENYASNDQYLRVSKKRRIVGFVCIISLLFLIVLPGESKEDREAYLTERRQNIDRDIEALVKKLDETTPETLNLKGREIGSSLIVTGMICEYCGGESITYFHDKKAVAIRGDTLQDFAKTKCPKSKDGKHSGELWYNRAYGYIPSEKKWSEIHGENSPKVDTATYKRCLLNKF